MYFYHLYARVTYEGRERERQIKKRKKTNEREREKRQRSAILSRAAHDYLY